MIRRYLLPLAAALTVLLSASLAAAAPLAAQKAPITSSDQLPRHTYDLSGTATETLQDSAKFAALAAAVEHDLLSDLAAYDIQDRATLKEYYGTLSGIALVRGRWDEAVAWTDSVRAVEEKPAQKAMTGLTARALAAAAGAPAADRAAAFRAAYRKEVAALPYEEVQAELKARMGSAQTLSKGLLLGIVQTSIEPAAKSGSISLQLAEGLVQVRTAMDVILPVRDPMVAVLADVVSAHDTQKPDIWKARDVSLAGREGLTPVVLGIWDSGVDTALYPDRLWVNPGEVAGNGKDDDGDGFVDDVHGIAWTLHSDPDTSLLFPLTYGKDREATFRSYLKGFTDLQAGLTTEEAARVRQVIAGLSPDQVKPFLEGLGQYSGYAHGTHVAGIASRGNPAARLAVARLTFDYHAVPETPTVAQARKDAAAARKTVAWFRAHGIRVVNMSWGESPRGVEQALELNNAGGTPAERKALARKIFDTYTDGLETAIQSAPDILFVPAAGNADSDNRFSDFMPASLDLPNVITAAAVDQAGDEAAFTSYGKADVYADGYEVDSRVPGGEEMRLSGTSMAAPQVVNLAGKLLAVDPGLTVAQLRHLIVDGADPKTIGGTHQIRLLDPKRSMQMLAEMRQGAGEGR